jgi:hypothetical protein
VAVNSIYASIIPSYTTKSKCGGETPVIMLISTALLLDSNIRNSVCTPAKLPCRRVEVGYENNLVLKSFSYRTQVMGHPVYTIAIPFR